MEDDDVDLMTASIAWLDNTAFAAQDLHVESMDFGLLTGDVVPRDGLPYSARRAADECPPHARARAPNSRSISRMCTKLT